MRMKKINAMTFLTRLHKYKSNSKYYAHNYVHISKKSCKVCVQLINNRQTKKTTTIKGRKKLQLHLLATVLTLELHQTS